jgi:CheY-like chemotaxis protein
VADTGCGIKPEVLPRIFEPFFTTKEVGKGTGLGLSTVNDIVKSNGGRIICDSAPEQGTTFRVYLPLCPRPLTAEPANGPAPVKRGQGHILLVEDDADLRAMFARILRATGYEVTDAPDAETALSLAAGLGGRLTALVTDMVMPGMNGQQLAAALEQTQPGLRVLYLSGYSDDVAFRGPIKSDVSFLQKPFSPQELCLKLQAVLAV